jgi:hypothetical protein
MRLGRIRAGPHRGSAGVSAKEGKRECASGGQSLSLNSACPFLEGSTRLNIQQAKTNKPEKHMLKKREAFIFIILPLLRREAIFKMGFGCP